MHPLHILKDLEFSPAHLAMRSPDFFSREVLIHSPLLLPDMEKAVEMIERRLRAIGQRSAAGIAVGSAVSAGTEEILIAGDRDVDGVTSTVLLIDHLRRSGVEAESIRFVNSSEGDDYGLTGRFLEKLQTSPAGLVILLDMGSAHLEQAFSLVEAGKEVIILDHHIPQIPEEFRDRMSQIAFVNPRLYARVDALEHQGKIATAGLVFKLILACEIKKTDLWTRLLCIDVPEQGRSFLYRSGAFLADEPSGGMDAILSGFISQGFRVFRSGVEELSGFCSIFRESTPASWRDLLVSSPVDFGKYLFACSLNQRPQLLLRTLRECDLASIGLIADLVPLVGENRRMVALGLGPERVRFAEKLKLKIDDLVRPGLLALYRESGLDPFDTLSRDINFTVNPLINAAGRLGQTEKALELLLCRDPERARLLAAGLRRLNLIRKERTEKNSRIVESHFTFDEADPLVFFYHPELEPGISGLMATRLLESAGRPVVWVNPDGAHARGSARSRPGWNMVELLQPLSEYLVQLGGHAEACGFTIAYDQIEVFRSALMIRSREYEASLGDAPAANPSPFLLSLSHRQLNTRLLGELSLLEPFGPENPEPVFQIAGVGIRSPSVMKRGVHLRFSLPDCRSDLEFVFWNCPSPLRERVMKTHGDGLSWNLSGVLERNRIPGMKPFRFRLHGIEPVEPEGEGDHQTEEANHSESASSV